MPGVRDGDPDSVHAARVATRRLREVLPLVSSSNPNMAARLGGVVRRAGRQLGRVRELDVMREHLERMGARFPDSAAAAAVGRRSLLKSQLRARRTLIRSFERLSFDRRVSKTLPAATTVASLRDRTRTFSDWGGRLRGRIGERARAVSSAVDHASGVYFPDRAHAARVATKKLRYTIEVAEQTGVWRPLNLLRDLRKVQADLGELHDAQVLLEQLDTLVPEDSVPPRERRVLAAALQSDIAAYHAKYVSKRERLRRICDACLRFAGDARSDRGHHIWTPARPLLAASALALPAAGLAFLTVRRAR